MPRDCTHSGGCGQLFDKIRKNKGVIGMGWLFNRKKKKQQDEFFQLLGDALKTANENAQTVGKAIYDRQAPDRSDFGLCETNPVCTTSLGGTENYLGRLCTKDGSKFTWSGYTSIRATVRGHADVGEDVYTLYLDGEKYTDIYVVPYVGESKFPPAGLYFCDEETDWDLEREAFGKGITGAQLLEIRKMEEENERERQRAQKELEEAVAKKSAHIVEKYAAFSIDEELKNPDFVFLANLDIDALVVYEYCHREELSFRKVTVASQNAEVPDSGYYFNILHDIENREMQQFIRERKEKTKRHMETNGFSHEDFLFMQNMEVENAEFKWKMRVKELRAIAKQAIEVQTLYPKFDLRAEWKNETFREITAKFGMRAAYEVTHFNECYSLSPIDEPVCQPAKEDPVPQQVIENQEKLFCRKCGAELFSDSFFCHKCGTGVIK